MPGAQAPSFGRWPSKAFAGLATVGVWALVAYQLVGWWLRDDPMTASSVGVAHAPTQALEPDTLAVARALGAQAPVVVAAPTLASRMQLVGVLNADPGTGVALIALDGKAAKPFRVGKPVTDGLVVQSTQAKRVNLGPAIDGPTTISLDLPVKK